MKPLRRSVASLSFLTAAAVAAPALAEQPAPALDVAAEAAPPAVPANVAEDAHIDRLFIAPTAETQARGSWSFNSYELLGAGVSYGVTDRIQISALTLLPITLEMPWFVNASVKGQVLRTDRFRLAVQGSAFFFRDAEDDHGDDLEPTEREMVGAFTAGGVGSLCLDGGCHTMLNGYLGAATSTEAGVRTIGIAGSLGAMVRVTKHVKLLAEVDFGGLAGEKMELADGVLAWYGVRFTSGKIAADLGLARPIAEDWPNELALGLPWVAFSYRGL